MSGLVGLRPAASAAWVGSPTKSPFTFYAGAVLDPLKAYKWLQVAAEEGDERAAHLKNEVAMQLPASELSQGIRGGDPPPPKNRGESLI